MFIVLSWFSLLSSMVLRWIVIECGLWCVLFSGLCIILLIRLSLSRCGVVMFIVLVVLCILFWFFYRIEV